MSLSLMIGAKISKPIVNTKGEQLYNSQGEPRWEVDQWATWKLNWIPHTIQVVTFLILTSSVIFLLIYWLKSRSPKKDLKTMTLNQ